MPMTPVLTIAWRDIKAYFSSPKGAGIFFFFLFLMGLFFNNFVSTFVEMQQRAPMMGGESPTVEQLLRALFYNLHFILILLIPAVTMSSFSEEKRNQTMRLLQTSPVTATQIVMGKFLACAFVLATVLFFSGVYPLFTKVYGNPDGGIILTSYLGILLLMCAQVAFGLWVSSMTNNQFMAFLFTMFGLFLLLILNWIAGSVGGHGTAEAVVKYIASTDHLENFFKGLLTVQSVTYFICFTAMFLFFTNVVLDSQRWR
jgi:ABC-2 type transport system permease protein